LILGFGAKLAFERILEGLVLAKRLHALASQGVEAHQAAVRFFMGTSRISGHGECALAARGAQATSVDAPDREGYLGPTMAQGPKDVFDTIRTLLAVRSYQSTPVPDALVRRIVEAGRLTGSGMNRQPWHFIVVREPETLRKLGALASSGPYVAQAPLAIVVATDRSRFAVSDASRAIQSMLLTAWADGVGSNWVGFGGLDNVKAVLDIPAGLDVLAILPFGYPARAVGKGKKARKPLREVAHLERFGRPFE